MTTISLQNKYQSKLRTAEEAIRMIRSGQRVFIGSGWWGIKRRKSNHEKTKTRKLN